MVPARDQYMKKDSCTGPRLPINSTGNEGPEERSSVGAASNAQKTPRTRCAFTLWLRWGQRLQPKRETIVDHHQPACFGDHHEVPHADVSEDNVVRAQEHEPLFDLRQEPEQNFARE